MAKIWYVLNPRSKRLHARVDGRSFEQCNLDQIEGARELPYTPKDVDWQWCKRCFRATLEPTRRGASEKVDQ